MQDFKSQNHKGKKILIIILSTAIILNVGVIASFEYHPLDNGTRETTIIKHLLGLGYTFRLPKDYTGQNKTVLLLHDADFNWNGLNKMISIEQSFNIKSCILPRFYLVSQKLNELKTLESKGFEIGFQYDTFNTKTFLSELGFMRENFNISTTDYHDIYFPLYNQTLWQQLGLKEIYVMNFSYYTDTGDKLVSPSVLGNLVVVMLHIDWTI